MCWLQAARARALLRGRGHVLPDDLKAIAVPVLALVPLLLYPVSKTLWTSIDLLMRPVEPGEVLPESEWR